MKKYVMLSTGLAASAVVVLAGSAAFGASSGDSPVRKPLRVHGGSAAVQDATPAEFALMQTQNRLHAVADRIEAVAEDTGTAGLAGIAVNPSTSLVRVYWHGAQSPALTAAVRSATGNGVRVEVVPAAYTGTQLAREANRLATAAVKHASFASIGPLPDGSGLQVGVATPVKTPATGAVATRDLSKLVPGLRSSIPMKARQSAVSSSATREADVSPYRGGALIQSDQFYCSSGYAVKDAAGISYLLTARHCGLGRWYTGGGRVLGDASKGVWRYDAELIKTSARGQIYNGASIAGGTTSFISVGATTRSRVGDVICTSGAFSGYACGITVKALGQLISVDGHVMAEVMAERNAHGQSSVGNGDSGGPVFSLLAGTPRKANVEGSLTAFDTTTVVKCIGVPTDQTADGRQCGWRIFYADAADQASALGFTVLGATDQPTPPVTATPTPPVTTTPPATTPPVTTPATTPPGTTPATTPPVTIPATTTPVTTPPATPKTSPTTTAQR